jgi:hypothetical protein
MLAMSETREALNAILAVPVADRTDEQTADRDRLTKEIQELEPEFRAALASEDWGRQERTETVDAEERERRELRSKVSLSGYVKAAAARTLPDAEYREYNAAVGAEPNEVPLDLLGQVERRAVTPGPTDDATDAIAPLRVRADHLRAVGAGLHQDDADRPLLQRHDDDGAGGGCHGARQGCGRGGDGWRVHAINGKAASPDFDGLFDIASDVARPGADQAFAAAKSEFVGKVDGRYAYSAMDLRAAIGSLSYGKMEGLYQSSGDYSVYDVLMKKLGALVISDRMPAATNSNTSQKGLIVLSAGGGPPRIEVPVWNRLQLIRDEYTAAKKGQIVLTVNALIGAPVVRYGTDVLKELHFRFA